MVPLVMILICLISARTASSYHADIFEEKIKQVDELFAKYDTPDSPGFALGIIKDGKFLYKRGYGAANLDYNVPNTPQTVFRIGSTSKQFTAACIAILIEEGKVSLDDPIQKHIPEMADMGKGVTVGDLVYHTSGIPDYEMLQMLQGEPDNQGNHHAEEIVELLSRQELIFEPKEKWDYSNSNYILMAVIIERVSGKTFAEFADERIFKPLGMTNSRIHDNNRLIIKNRAVGYSEQAGEFYIDETITELVGDDGVFTTVEDLFLWDQNFYDSKIIGPDFPQHLQKVGQLKTGEDHTYAFGLIISTYKGLKTVSHGGAFVGFRAQMLRFPEQRCTIILLANLANISPGEMCFKVADIILADHLKEEPKKEKKVEKKDESMSIPPDQLKQYEGYFEDIESGVVIQVALEDSGLYLKVMGQKYLLRPVKTNILKADAPIGITVDYSNLNKDQTVLFDVETQGQFHMRSISPDRISPDQLSEYTGEYVSEQLMTEYTLEVRDEVLHLRLVKQARSYPLTPKSRDSFSASGEFGGASLDFQRGSKEEITGFLVRFPMSRVKNIHFIKK